MKHHFGETYKDTSMVTQYLENIQKFFEMLQKNNNDDLQEVVVTSGSMRIKKGYLVSFVEKDPC